MAFSIPAKREPVGVADHRDHQAALGADGDADVVDVVVDDVLAVDPAVDGGERLQRLDRRLDEERHEAEGDAVLRLEGVLVLRAQVHDPRHVGFVEGRQDRGGLLGLDQPLGDLLADAAHPLAGLARRPPARRRGAGPGGGTAGAGGRRAARAGGRRGEVGEDVALGEPAASAGPLDLGRVDVLLGDEPADGGRERRAPPFGAGAAGGGPAGGFGRRRGAGAGAAWRRRRRRGRGPRGRSCRRSAPMATVVPSATPTFRTPDDGGGDDVARLVGLQLEERVARLDGGAVGLQPARQDALGDRLADARDGDRDGGHGRSLLALRARPGPGRVRRDQVRQGRRPDGGLDELGLLAVVDVVRARSRGWRWRRGRRTGTGSPSSPEPGRDERPAAHVLRLFLHPDPLPGHAVSAQGAFSEWAGHG